MAVTFHTWYINSLSKQNTKVKQNVSSLDTSVVTWNTHVKYQSSSTHCSKVISKVKGFKNGSNSKVTGKKYWYPQKGRITGIIHVKYQSSSTNCSKVISKIKFSKMVQTSKSRSQGKKSWYPQKGLVTRNTHMKYQSSSTHCQKLLARLKFQRGGQNDRITEWQNYRMTEWQTGQKQYAPRSSILGA